MNSTTGAAELPEALPRYREYMHLRTTGAWSDGVPAWARDYSGCMNDMTAAHAVIEELHAKVEALSAAQAVVPAEATVNRETVIEWLDANDIEVTDRQMEGLFHFAAPTPPAQASDSVLEDAAQGYERRHAIRQGHEIATSDAYFEARPQIDSNDHRKVFQAGFERGWDAAMAAKNGDTHE